MAAGIMSEDKYEVDDFLNRLPEPYRGRLSLALAVSGFRADVAAKRPLLESLFNIVPLARKKVTDVERKLASYLDTEESTREAFENTAKKNEIWEMGANRALYTDAASALILISATELDRLHRRASVDLFERGAETYVHGIYIARAIYALANQYKHLAKWRSEGTLNDDAPIVAALVGEASREDAAAEFLLRGYPRYEEFEDALLSCADNIVTDGSIPASGRGGIPRITMRPGAKG
jgi:hypothetical protein